MTTVAELIEKLKTLPLDAEVFVWAGERGAWELESAEFENGKVFISAKDCLA